MYPGYYISPKGLVSQVDGTHNETIPIEKAFKLGYIRVRLYRNHASVQGPWLTNNSNLAKWANLVRPIVPDKFMDVHLHDTKARTHEKTNLNKL